MMDDWPSTISFRGLFKNYWRKKIDSEFRILLSRIDIFLSISDAMSEEYFKRYKKRFIPFHNPIDLSRFSKTNNILIKSNTNYRILYIGRIGMANKNSIISFAQSISHFTNSTYTLNIDIITPDADTKASDILRKMRNVSVLPPVSHSLVPSVLIEYDFLLLPLDFNQIGLRFAQYSIPTKASEYMASGTPVIVYAPDKTAISKFFTDNECGYCITNYNRDRLINAIDVLIKNKELRKKISEKAIYIARTRFNAEKVRLDFHNMIRSCYKI